MSDTEARDYISPEPGLDGAAGSYWIASTDPPAYPALGEDDVEVDVAVVGAGIVGVTTAHLLKESGRTVALLEMRRVAADVTGHTTGKLTAQHGAVYDEIVRRFGREQASVYARAQTEAIDAVFRIAEERGIDCDLARSPSYAFTTDRHAAERLRREADAEAQAGLAAEFVTELPLPITVGGAVRTEWQARFHPLRFLLPLADAIPGEGSHVFERTRVQEVRDGSPCEVRTGGGGRVRARSVVVAAHFPFHDNGVFFPRMYPERSYAFAVRLLERVPEGLYYEVDGPMRSLRPQPVDGGRLLIVGGEPHKAGQGGDERERYTALQQWVLATFPVASVENHWSTQDNHTDDGVPYVGRWPGRDNVYVATGFGGWGMSNGVASARLIASMIAGEADEEQVALFDPSRIKPVASASAFVKQNLNVAAAFVGDRVGVPKMSSAKEVEAGEGVVAEFGGTKAAVYRSPGGEVSAVSPTCTHLYCTVRFNEAEDTWDCPCHGSRYDTGGHVLHGPATHDLKRVGIREG